VIAEVTKPQPSNQNTQRARSPKSKIRNILGIAVQRLSAAGCDTPRLDAEVLLAHSLGQERAWLYLHDSDPVDEVRVREFEALLRRREQREPVAYIVGYKEFFGLEFKVNPHVLIPRPETELLVETTLKIYDLRSTIYDFNSRTANPKSKIVDVGTGSGCIAITLTPERRAS
jgi:release factor glutamine methyltransferase